MEARRSRALHLTVAAVAAMFALGSFALAWPVASALVKMYADFGSVLPAPTELAVTWGRWMLTVGALAAVGVAVTVAARAREVWPAVVALVAEAAFAAAYLWAMYLPIFGTCAGAIK